MQFEYQASGGDPPPNVVLIAVECWVQWTFQAMLPASSPTGGLVWGATEQC